jgi:transposase
MLHRTRHLFIRQQTSVSNAIRARLAEFGVTAPVGRKGIEELLHVIADPSDNRIPGVVRACLAALGSQLLSLKKQILDFDRMILAWHRSNQTNKRLNCIPGVGPLLATALVSSVADPKAFRSARNFSAWIGLVPKQHSSGGVGTGSAVSANRETDICAACSWRAHSPSSAMPNSMAPSTGLGAQRCWQEGRPKSPPSR